MSYLEQFIHVVEVNQPVCDIPLRTSPISDGFVFAVRKAHDLAALRQAVIAKFEASLDEHVMPCGLISGMLDPSVKPLTTMADYTDQELHILRHASFDPIVHHASGGWCLLTTTFQWQTLPVTHRQALGILHLIRDNARLRFQPVALTTRAQADRGLAHAIGQRGHPMIGLIETTFR
jgi:hypothetical protein